MNIETDNIIFDTSNSKLSDSICFLKINNFDNILIPTREISKQIKNGDIICSHWIYLNKWLVQLEIN